MAPSRREAVQGTGSTRRHGGGSSQDRAVYTCQCGCVFDELVSTSVSCPNCACTQAW